ncbi:hypothetical protein sS8_4468 [Methylocaldum marinum]|uniref:Uncharacterized protein n=1 Tax=Methylocaldum marinum TaxID=1432792 RepID=A0A250KXI7_9GAMM|nr:hypothetical protein [Methylocaldum marinum]BBA36398.1 hypothetical protein sS8_4468 [Methylocaldum marinum]
MIRHLSIALLAIPATALADNHRPEDWPEGSAMHMGAPRKTLNFDENPALIF